jgi:hypothetical protein
MASIIRIKRSSTSGNPSTLAAGELAYSALTDNGSNGGDRLYVGIGTETAGDAANHYVIGGKFFTDRLDHTAGTLTASSAIVVDASSKIDVLNVDNLTLNGNTLSSTDTNGNILITPNGTGKTVVTNLYINDVSTSIDEYIYDTVGGAVTAGTGITVTNDDPGNTSTISITNTGVTAATYGSATAIPVFTTLNITDDAANTDGVDLLTDTLLYSSGEGIDVTVSNNTVTIAGEDASYSNKGVASFDSTDFTVVAGAVIINSTTLGTSQLNPGATTSTLAGLQQLDVDNIRIDGNEISSTDTNGNISLNPNGTGTVAVNGAKITGLAEPTASDDAATKGYVDARAAGLDPKQSVRAATTGNINISTDLENGDTIDGVTLATGDRVLVKDQSTGSQNGIYVVVSSGAASRSTDMDEDEEVTAGLFFFVEEGTTNADSGWVLTSDNPLVVDTDALTFTQFSGAGQITAGAALSKTGNTLDVEVAANGGIEISSDALQLKSSLAGAGLTYTTGVLDVVGTANRITVNANDIDIASTYVGQSSITTLGTIGTGTWNATVIDEVYGGTGQSSYATGDLLYASASNTLSKLAGGADGKVLQMNASGVPVWGDVDGGTY